MSKKNLFTELGLIGFFLIITSLYLLDTYKASARTENLLLILPAAVIVITLCLWILIKIFLDYKRTASDDATQPTKKKEKNKVSVFGAMVIFAGFVLAMDWIGFDAATFLFVLAMLWLQGERRWYWLAPFPLIFSFLVSLFFEYMISYPMPMLLGREFIERFL